ncbi:MAG: alpha-glucuronidase [Bacteroidaceae bacterium]|nr:alpha-glucuronidase [Bacteroidaceae bacterium]
MRKFLFTTLLLAICHCIWAEQIELRLLNHWDNPDGTIERGYAGRSIWKWEEIPAGKKQMPVELRERYEEYGRINQEYGINGTVLNNVNAKQLMLTSDMLKKTAKIADILRPYGIKVYLSINFASPKTLGEVATADPLNEDVQKWWAKKAKEIYKLIPDFGGFLVKANSEGEPGPMDYGRTHVDGANMLANALKPYGGIVMWRAFVYSAKSGEKNTEKSLAQRAYESDRANQAYEEFIHFDGQFADNVIIQIKNGPIDFQPREPVSPLFFALKKTKMMVEFQITQEYTGGSIQTCFLAPMWREFFDTLNMVDERPKLVGVAGVANIGDAENWTANDLAMANWYAFGRLANDTEASSLDIAEDFLRKNYSDDERFVRPMSQLLLKSREAVVDYMMPLGLHHIFAGGHHYGPEPWCNPRGWREDWLPKFYHRADSIGLGFNRTDHTEPCLAGNEGSNNVSQYPEPLRTLYNNIKTCPENLLLWFHHTPWDYTMNNGLSMWDNLCYTYDRGVRQAAEFVKTWESAKPYVNAEKYERQLIRFQRQARDAQWWRDACLLYFQQFSGKQLPPDSPAPQFTLKQLMDYHLNIDNYTSAPIDQLP